MRRQILFGLLALALVSCGRQPADQVNMFDGTDSAGKTFPGATVPFGSIQLSPDTDTSMCSGYDYSQNIILGFSHAHLSGTDGPAQGDFLVTPGLKVVEPLTFSHGNEYACPGYYKVSFDKGITAELTITPHAGVHRYTFKGEGTRLIRIDARHCIGGRGEVADCRLSLDGSEILGYRRVAGPEKDREAFLSAVFTQPFLSAEEPEPGLLEFTFADNLKEVVLFAGISGVDANGARGNRVKQTAGGQFDGLRLRAGRSWEEALGKIAVKGGPTDAFYTHLYQAFTAPTRIDDYDRRYRDRSGRNLQLPEGHHFYSTRSIGDSFPVWNALEALLDTALVHDVVRSLVDNPGGRSELPAQYVLASIGLDPAGPATGEYLLTAPLFRESVLRLANGKTLTIKADHPGRPYIAAVKRNGEPLDRNRLTYDEILDGGVLSFKLSAKPVAEWENLARNAAWGDTGDGFYRNPVLLADYSDPDAIRFGDRYYMVASDFHFMGMQVLESADLVNWHLVSQIYSRLDLPGWDANKHYAGGSWAPSIRYHDGLFYVYFCTPDEGLFMSTASDPAGPWTPLHCVKAVYHWEDPCPFWDEDGQAYLGHSLHGAGPIILHKMSPDGRELLDEGVTVYQGPVAEGTKIHKWNGEYYMSIPEGGVGGGWQTVLRSKDIYGPYERRIVLETGSTSINGPHQGAIVDTPDGEWWFLHFQERDPLGRVVHLQPMHWEDGWPVMGEDYDGNGVGEPVSRWQKPSSAVAGERELPASSDSFQGPELGLQWQFNHNPQDEGWSLTRRQGCLALDGLPAASFREARNTLTQKLMGYRGAYTVRMDLADLADGQKAGLACMGRNNFCIGIRQASGRRELFVEKDGEVLDARPWEAAIVWLRLSFDAEAQEGGFSFLYSADGMRFDPFGEAFAAHNGFWKGARPALFSYNTEQRAGTAWFRDFVFVER